ncbi:hypothetical protein S518_005279 [Salmonella enterica subsp. enterica]|nr:hypothetical protein [Salmonella enterica subsp. enterica]
MKIYNTSLIKKGILLSLVLLSPEILAAENLNFNYTRADALSLDPRMGIQAKACHSLGDPINISFQLGRLYPAPEITLDIKGKAFSKSYSIFSGEKDRSAGGDNSSFSIPFNITKNGSVKGTSVVNVTYPETDLTYNNKFCFSDKRMANLPLTEGYIPLIEGDAKTGKDYEKFCSQLGWVGTAQYVWGGDPRTTPMPDHIKAWGKGNWTRTIYFMTFTPGQPSHTGLENQSFDGKIDDDGEVVSGINNYVLPLQYDSTNTVSTVIEKAKLSYELSNRDITELKVFVRASDVLYKWEWTTSPDNPNVLRLKYTNPVVAPVISSMPNDPAAPTDPKDDTPPNPAKSDPYVKNNFYAKSNFYKGTLAAKGDLNQRYQYYIQNIVPLSLPPDTAGDINLANTDSLSFTLRQTANSSQGYMQLSVYGQPLQFAPLKFGDKVVASAMQVRNACY